MVVANRILSLKASRTARVETTSARVIVCSYVLALHLIDGSLIGLHHYSSPPTPGESAVGKSSLVLRFVKGQFHEYQESTIGGKCSLRHTHR